MNKKAERKSDFDFDIDFKNTDLNQERKEDADLDDFSLFDLSKSDNKKEKHGKLKDISFSDRESLLDYETYPDYDETEVSDISYESPEDTAAENSDEIIDENITDEIKAQDAHDLEDTHDNISITNDAIVKDEYTDKHFDLNDSFENKSKEQSIMRKNEFSDSKEPEFRKNLSTEDVDISFVNWRQRTPSPSSEKQRIYNSALSQNITSTSYTNHRKPLDDWQDSNASISSDDVEIKFCNFRLSSNTDNKNSDSQKKN